MPDPSFIEARQAEKARKERARPMLPHAYPDYGRSLVSQSKLDPTESGIGRGIQTGALGALLAALATRLATDDKRKILAAAGIGGVAAGIPGYISGSDEAKSDYSKLLFLRRLGISSPGELETLIKMPVTAPQSLAEKAAAINPDSVHGLKMLIGALVGGGIGYYGTPHIGGYEDVEGARRISAVLNAGLGAIGGSKLHEAGGFKGLLNPKIVPAADWKRGIMGFMGAEMPSVGMSVMKRMSDASKAQAEAAKTSSIPKGISDALTSPTAKGVGMGAAGAGLGAVLTGLMRRKTMAEQEEGTPRMSMVNSDFLKLLLPAMLAGGMAGSFMKTPPEAQSAH